MKTNRVARGFDLLAPVYELLLCLTVGKSVRKAQLPFLHVIKPEDKVLLFGGGTGWILPFIESHNPESIVYLDLSSKMLKKARKNALGGNVEFRNGSYKDIIGQKFDVIITPFVLDCFTEEELNLLIGIFHESLNDKGRFLFSDFSTSNSFINSAFIWILNLSSNIICGTVNWRLPDFFEAFKKNDFDLIERTCFNNGLTQSVLFVKKRCN